MRKSLPYQVIEPDYQNSIANLACSILRYYHIDPPNGTLPLADRFLAKEYKNVVVILLDGMGSHIMEKHLDSDGFFRRNLRGNYLSVFPSTTVAATTSMLSGLFPNQHCWLGWDCYFKELDKNITVFNNTVQISGEEAAGYHVASTYCPYTGLTERLQSAGVSAYRVSPFVPPFPNSFEDECAMIQSLCAQEGNKYIYAYWHEPDKMMHQRGTSGEGVRELLLELESGVEALADSLENTLIIVTADHGHLDCRGVVITECPELYECLIRMPSIEPRVPNFFVKPEMRDVFRERFYERFSDSFLLLFRDEVKDKKLFGTGENASRFDDMIGDFIGAAVSDLAVFNTRQKMERFKSCHAGLTRDEMEIPLIIAGRCSA